MFQRSPWSNAYIVFERKLGLIFCVMMKFTSYIIKWSELIMERFPQILFYEKGVSWRWSSSVLFVKFSLPFLRSLFIILYILNLLHIIHFRLCWARYRLSLFNIPIRFCFVRKAVQNLLCYHGDKPFFFPVFFLFYFFFFLQLCNNQSLQYEPRSDDFCRPVVWQCSFTMYCSVTLYLFLSYPVRIHYPGDYLHLYVSSLHLLR